MNLLPLAYRSTRTGPRFLIYADGRFREWQPAPKRAKQVFRFMGLDPHDALPLTLTDSSVTHCRRFKIPSCEAIDNAIARFRLPRWQVVAACERFGVPGEDHRAIMRLVWTGKVSRGFGSRLDRYGRCVAEIAAILSRRGMVDLKHGR